MNLKKKSSFIIFLFSLILSKEIYSIHHHPRIPINFLENSIFFGKKRVVLLNITKNEAEKLKKEIKIKNCEIENRKLEFLFKKNSEYYYLKNNKKEHSLTYVLPHKVSLIGLDGYLKYSNSEIESLDRYFLFIDQMPIRKKEKKSDKLCN